MNGRELSKALRTGASVFGTCVVSPSPFWPSQLAGTGIDFVFIDTEHIALDRVALSWMSQAYVNQGFASLVRIAEADPGLASMALDGGATGIIAPYVESAQQVRELVGAVKFRPLKGKRLEQLLDGAAIEPALERYLDRRNVQQVLVVNVESVPAIEALDEILRVPGLDGVLIGPHDLSCSLGIPEQYDHPAFDAAVRDIIARARAHNVGAGIHWWGSPEQAKGWIQAGMNMLIHSSDIMLFTAGLSRDIQAFKGKATNGAVPAPHKPRAAVI